MSSRHGGNGESKTLIDFHEGPGYALISPRDTTNHPADIALILNQAFNEWLRKRLGIRVRAALPITGTARRSPSTSGSIGPISRPRLSQSSHAS